MSLKLCAAALIAVTGCAAAQGYQPTHKYGKFLAGCVNGYNIQMHRQKSVLQCQEICDNNPKCLAFEYGVAYRGGGGYKPGDCQEQSSTNRAGCDGKFHNLDLYIKGANIIKTTTSTQTTTTTTLTLHPKIDKMAEQIKQLEAALAKGDQAAEMAVVKKALEAADSQIQEQGKTIYKLTVKINEEKVAREALAKTVGSLPQQFAALREQMAEQQKASALNDDNILEILDAAAKSAAKDAPAPESTLDSACGKGCTAPQISTQGQDLLLEAPSGKIGIFSQKCSAGVDVCELASLAKQVKDALAMLDMGNA